MSEERLKESTEQLRRSHEEVRRLGETASRREVLLQEAQAMAHLGNFEWNVVNQTLWWSDEMYRIHAWDPLGTPITIENTVALVRATERKGVMRVLDRVLRTGEAAALDYSIVRPDGEIRNMHGKARVSIDASTGDPCVIGTIQDITDRKKLESGLVASDRLATLGLLVSGIAHEINNPLVNILSNLGYLRDDLSRLSTADVHAPPPPLLEMVADIEQGATQIRDLVEALKAFSRAEQLALGPVNVHRLLDMVTALVRHDLRDKALLEKSYDSRVLTVSGDESKLGQVFINVLVNAAQAIPPGAAADNRIRVTTGTAVDGRIRIEVSDSGVGMTPDLQARLFTPFFTTKAVGVGKGLGLSISRAIVEQHAGTIEVDSSPGRGSTFRVLLPPAGKSAASDGTLQGEQR